MGGTISFHDQKKEFLKNVKVEVDIPEFMKKRRTGDEIEQYTGKHNQMAKAINNRKKVKLTKSAKKLLKIGLAALIAFGGYKTYSEYSTHKKENAPITLEEALENGETLKSLKIDGNVKNELEEVKQQLSDENITNRNLIELAPKIYNLQLDNLKTKLAMTLGVEEFDIHLHTNADPMDELETIEEIEVDGGETYSNISSSKNENTISKEISDYIIKTGDIETLIRQVQEGDFKRNDILKEYKEAVESIDQMAASKITIDKNGNISAEQTKVKDLKENKKEKGQVAYTQEIDDDMER